MKAIIVGASSGIGYEVAKLLIAKGWIVGVAARRVDRLMDLKASYVEQIDVTMSDADQKLSNLIYKMGGIDLYFHVSGIGKQNRNLFPDIELNTVQTNALGFTRMVGEAYRHFAIQGKGHIACISSIAGTKGLGPAPSYSATKAFQNVYMQALEQQAQSRNLAISFTDIRPGFVDTDLLNGDFHYPLMLKPERVAKTIVHAIIHQRRIVVIDWKWRLITFFWSLLPNRLWRLLKL